MIHMETMENSRKIFYKTMEFKLIFKSYIYFMLVHKRTVHQYTSNLLVI